MLKKSFSYDLIFVTLFYALLGCLISCCYIKNTSSITYNFGQVFQLVSIILFCLFYFVGYYSEKTYCVIFIFIFQIITMLGLYCFYSFVLNNDFGPNADDSLFYQNLFVETRYLGFTDFLTRVWNDRRIYHSIDDIGYPFCRFLIGKFFFFIASENIPFIILFLNSVIHAIGSAYLFKLSAFFLSKKNAKIVMLLWGFSTAIVWLGASGLKEVIFSNIVIICLYHMQCIVLNVGKIRHLFPFLVLLVCTAFFRIYVFLFIFFSFLFSTLFRKIFEKYFVIVVLFFILFSYTGVDLLSFIFPKLGILAHARNYKLQTQFGANSLFTNTLNFILGWIGTIPSFTPKSQFNNLISLTYSISKFYFSFIFILGVYFVFINKTKKFYPILFVVICNIILTIVTVFSLEYRFSIPCVYIYYIVILNVYENSHRKYKGFFLSFSLVHILIIFISSILLLFYNLR